MRLVKTAERETNRLTAIQPVGLLECVSFGEFTITGNKGCTFAIQTFASA
jgi:hypothetical protein